MAQQPAQLTSLTTEPLFFGSQEVGHLPSSQRGDRACALSAEDFATRMSAIRQQHFPGDDAGAIQRAIGNFRGSAVNWWQTSMELQTDNIDHNALQTNWTVFIAFFKKRWFQQSSRWDTATTYLSLRQGATESAHDFFERICYHYLVDQRLLKEDLQEPLDNLPLDFAANAAAARIWLDGLPAAERAHAQNIHVHAVSAAVRLVFNRQRDADLSRAIVMSVRNDQLKAAIRKKAATPITFDRLSAFIRTEEMALAQAKRQSALRHVNEVATTETESPSDAEDYAPPANADGDTGGFEDAHDFTDADVVEHVDAVTGRRFFRFRGRGRGRGRGGHRGGRGGRQRPSGQDAPTGSAQPPQAVHTTNACAICNGQDHSGANCPTLLNNVAAVMRAQDVEDIARHLQAPEN